MNKDIDAFFPCSCGDHTTLRIMHHKDWPFEVAISMLSAELDGSRVRLAHQLRQVWQIIKYGTPYVDHISFYREDVERMRDTLEDILSAEVARDIRGSS